MMERRYRKHYKIIGGIVFFIILTIVHNQLLKSKRLIVTKGRNTTISFSVFSSAVKGFRLYLQPENLKSVIKDMTLSVEKCDCAGDISNPNFLLWGIPKEGISIIDLRRTVPADGELNAWAIHSAIDGGNVKFKVWREDGENWICVGESETEVLSKGNNFCNLEDNISVKKGDYLGFYTAEGSISFQPWSSGAGKVYYLGDVKQGLKSSGITDREAGYCIKAYYVPKKIARFDIDGRSLKKGYYSFFSPDFCKLKDSIVNIVISSNGGAEGNSAVSVLPSLKNGIFSSTGNFYTKPIYSASASTTENIEYPSPVKDYVYLFFNWGCILLLSSSFVLL